MKHVSYVYHLLNEKQYKRKKDIDAQHFLFTVTFFLGEVSIDDAHRHPLIRPAMQLIEMTLQNCQEYPVRKSLLIFK